MGIYRLLLAVCVLLHHAHGPIFGWHSGASAVISFYLLSGFVMTTLLQRHYASPKRVPDFYLDRLARLFPQFAFYLLVTGILIATVRIDSTFLGGCNAYKVALNIAMLPLDFWEYRRLGLYDCQIIPQAWSLGLELSFYLVAPVIVLAPRLAKWMTLGSVGIFLLAYLGSINTDVFGYRLLPGIFFIFMAGAALANDKLFGSRFPWIVWLGGALCFAVMLSSSRLYGLPYNKEVLTGLLIGIPVLFVIRNLPFSKWDEFLGNLSYGIFLNHFFCLYLFQVMSTEFTNSRSGVFLIALLVMSAAMALASYYLIELPALHWRRSVRYRSARASPVAAQG